MPLQVNIAGCDPRVQSRELGREAPAIGLHDKPDGLRRRDDTIWTDSHWLHLILTAGH
jgi:hypothetical protein